MSDQPQLEKEMFEEYARLKAEEKRVAERIEELGPMLKEAMAANGTDKVDVPDVGSFTLSDRTTWKYSPAVEKLQEQEKANGTAKRLISTSLRFTAPKVS